MIRDLAKEAREQEVRDLQNLKAKERERLLALAREDLRKELDAALTDLHQEANQNRTRESYPVTRTLARFGSLLGVLSRQASDQADRAEKVSRDNLAVQTAMLNVTQGVFWLSIGLGFIAVAQILLGYFQLKATKPQNVPAYQQRENETGEAQKPLQSPVNGPTQH